MRRTPDMPSPVSQENILNTMTDEVRKEYLKSFKKTNNINNKNYSINNK